MTLKTAQLLNGRETADKLLSRLAEKITAYQQGGYPVPSLAVVLVGQNPASQIYVNTKKATAEKIGIRSIIHALPESISEQELLTLIEQLNQDDTLDGILVQMPLPNHISRHSIIEKISPHKDVDGFHPVHLGHLAQGRPSVRPCTPYGIIKLLESYSLSLTGLHGVVIGASTIVGRPMALELLMAGCTVSICHSKTPEPVLAKLTQSADLLISATGKKDIIRPDFIKPGAIIIDVGIHREETGELSGDLDFDAICQKAGYITPVPGGVGPMTVAMLLENTVQLWHTRRKI